MTSTTLDTTKGPLVIRRVVDSDAPAIRDLRLDALRNCPAAFYPDYETVSRWPMQNWVEQARGWSADAPAETVFLAEHRGQLAGMIALRRNFLAKTRHAGTLWGLFVRPEWRSTGVSDALVQAALTQAAELRLRRLKTAVPSNNAPALHLFIRRGFSVYGVDPEVLRHEEVLLDEILLSRLV